MLIARQHSTMMPLQLFSATLLAGLLSLAGVLSAQEPQSAPSTAPSSGASGETPGSGSNAVSGAAPVKVLRAYANLVQIPVLVLDRDRLPMLRLDPTRFSMNIDAGPSFKPKHVRSEGSDPIRLTILLDERASTAVVAPEFLQAIPRLFPGLLGRDDSVNVGIIRNCVLLQTSTFTAIPAHLTSAMAALQKGEGALNGSCRDKNRLWDSTFELLHKIDDAPGRRVIILVSDGVDSGSKINTRQLISRAADQSAAIFGIRERPAQDDPRSGQAALSAYSRALSVGDTLAFVTESAGGMTLEGTNHTAQQELERVLMLVRGRYILDFVRPSSLASGTHILNVSIGDPRAFLRAAGVGMPVADPSLLTDPNRVPNDTAQEPQSGAQHQ